MTATIRGRIWRTPVHFSGYHPPPAPAYAWIYEVRAGTHLLVRDFVTTQPAALHRACCHIRLATEIVANQD